MLYTLAASEIRLVLKKPAEILQPVIFGLITLTLFVLAIGPDRAMLSAVAGAIIWVIILLAILLSSERLFFADMEDGALEQMQLASCPFFMVIAIKLLVHWLMLVLPLVIAAPLFARLLFLDTSLITPLVCALLLGTPAVVLFSALGSALTLSLRRGSLLLGLIIAPLYVPVLIISVSAFKAAEIGLGYSGQLALLAAITLSSILVCLPAITGALKLNT